MTEVVHAADYARVASEAKKQSRSKLVADLFARHCELFRVQRPERELLFAQSIGRRWRFDFAWPSHKLAVEIEGLVVMRINGELVCKGRHASISGFKEDCEKYAWATVLGWRVMRFEQSQVKDKTAINMVTRAMAALPVIASTAEPLNHQPALQLTLPAAPSKDTMRNPPPF